MIAVDAMLCELDEDDIEFDRQRLQLLLDKKLADDAHGKLPEWRAILAALPSFDVDEILLDRAAVTVRAHDADSGAIAELRRLLLALVPWRKGPFEIFGIEIDAEWRSDRKWDRLSGAISPLSDRRVLDVGCGNGYYAMRMSAEKARFVLGVDPTLQHLVQYAAIQHYVHQARLHLLPLRLDELPVTRGCFDTAFSMGVLYHRRKPLEHLLELRHALRPGGELVLETLIWPGEGLHVETLRGRYARMRNVWQLPTCRQLMHWLAESGFVACRTLDISVTASDEQRSTEWMPFESLDKALDPEKPALTIEGLPRPTRAMVICESPQT